VVFEVLTAALLLLQEFSQGVNAASVARLFAGFFLILLIFSTALLFTWWISNEE
jgi:hypothetical protein